MGLIEDARRLAAHHVTTPFCECVFCDNLIGGCGQHTGGHSPDCPWLAMPRIVQALEAARDVLDHVDDVEWAQDSLRHDEDTARLREAMRDAS